MDPAWPDVFLAAAAEPERWSADRAALAARLGELVRAAREEWPELLVEPARFVSYLAARVASGVPASEALALHAADLLLAERCFEGDPTALAIIEARHLADAPKYVARYARTPERLADVLQVVRERLFVGGEAKIKDYTGRGPLGGWLRSTIVNTAIKIGVRDARQVPSSIDGFEDELFTRSDPDLALFRTRFGPVFRLAFQTALRSLTAEEANFLRWSVVEGKSIDKIAAMLGVHRATAARRLAACRTKLYEATRDELAERVPGSATELHSMMRALKSVLETSLKKFLAP